MVGLPGNWYELNHKITLRTKMAWIFFLKQNLFMRVVGFFLFYLFIFCRCSRIKQIGRVFFFFSFFCPVQRERERESADSRGLASNRPQQ